MRILFLIFLAMAFLAPQSAFTSNQSGLELSQKCAVTPSCELVIFNEISRLYRPSGDEVALENYIRSLKISAKKEIWKIPLSGAQDHLGNIVIQIPATGKYRFLKNVKPIALQSHMDMIFAYANAKPGEDIKKYFIHGVSTEVVNGWLQSTSRMTTLGADNGIGVSIALRYLLNPNLIHPPLELIFTVQEEVGLKGALGITIPIVSRRMINLDGMTPLPTAILTASQGSFGANLNLNSIQGQPLSNDDLLFTVNLTGLLGGHSGNDIFRKRLNAMKGFAALYRDLKRDIPDLRIQSSVAGNLSVLNAIPNLFSVVFAFKKQEQPVNFENLVRKYMADIISQYPDETKDYKLEVVASTPRQVPSFVASSELSDAIVTGIMNAPNGVLESDAAFPNSVKTSSNLSNWGLSPQPDGTFHWTLGFFSRSYVLARLNKVAGEIQNQIEFPLTPFGKPNIAVQSSYPPWVAPKSSPLQRAILAPGQNFNMTTMAAVGLEPSAFLQHDPDLDVVAIAPMILDAHTVNERMEIASVARVSIGIQKILENLE